MNKTESNTDHTNQKASMNYFERRAVRLKELNEQKQKVKVKKRCRKKGANILSPEPG